ncbi:MAG: RidA family protein [Gemmatimonadales bacterium]
MTGMGRWRFVVAVLAGFGVGCAPVGGFGGPPGAADFDPGTRFIHPGTLPGIEGFTHAVKVGPTIYISGQVALDSTGRLVGPGDLRAQARQAFANLAFVLQIAGARPADVVKLTLYVVNYRPEDLAIIREAGAEFFPERNPPAGIVVGVQSLPKEGLLIAVDGIAQTRGMFQPRVREPR